MAESAQDCDTLHMTAMYLATAALLMLSVAGVRYQRPSVSLPVIVMVLAGAGWNLLRAVRGADDPEPSVTVAVNVAVVQICVVAFYVTCRRLVHGRIRARAWQWIVAAVIAAVSFVGMLPAVGITDGVRYYDSPVFVVHLTYTFALLGAGVLTLSQRQHDPSTHVHRYIVATEAVALLIVTTQVAVPALTSIAAAGLALLAVWTTGHGREWSQSASRAGRLVDSIGIFVFVVDRRGFLQDWNGPAASLLELCGTTATRGLDLSQALGVDGPFTDDQNVNLSIRGGMLRTAVTVHDVDPRSRHTDRVLMFRPVRTSFESSSFPVVSGALKGHDPATHTLGRKAALEQIQHAAAAGNLVVRIDIEAADRDRADELMFLMARRIESRSSEEGWSHLEWARLDTWVFVAELSDSPTATVPMQIEVDDLGVVAAVSSYQPRPGESPTDFVSRVSAAHRDGNGNGNGDVSAQGS